MSHAITVKRLTKEYFDISKEQKPGFNQFLTGDEEIVVRLNNKIYRFIN